MVKLPDGQIGKHISHLTLPNWRSLKGPFEQARAPPWLNMPHKIGHSATVALVTPHSLRNKRSGTSGTCIAGGSVAPGATEVQLVTAKLVSFKFRTKSVITHIYSPVNIWCRRCRDFHLHPHWERKGKSHTPLVCLYHTRIGNCRWLHYSMDSFREGELHLCLSLLETRQELLRLKCRRV